jgi:hypothetical protein
MILFAFIFPLLLEISPAGELVDLLLKSLIFEGLQELLQDAKILRQSLELFAYSILS